MRKLYLILIGLIILAVVFSGCAGKKSPGQPQQKPATQGQTLEGNISVPGDKDLMIEDVQASPDEAVDMGSLI